MFINPMHCCDFYKTSHRVQYPKNTTLVYSNFTPRSSRLANLPDDWDGGVVFFGLQYFCRWFLQECFNDFFFGQNKEDVVHQYKRRMDTALGKDAVAVEHIEALHDLGYLPIEIRALPEGTVVPSRTPVLTIHNTLPEFFWLTNYLETMLSCYLWKACTSATTARYYRGLLEKYAELTGSPVEFVDWQAHDFSFRGMSGLQDAALSGAGHLLYFTGTDTVPAIDLLEDYYHADAKQEMIGGSVPATEHSVMCMGSQEGELDTFRRLLTEIHPTGIVSIVSDSWDFWKVVTDFMWGLKQVIMNREGKLVIRPDSGDPVKILVGDPARTEGTPAHKGAVECLWDVFGGTITETGHRLLDSHIGLIYGDSITPERAKKILEGLAAKGFASANVVFGIGSYTYQHVTRDSHGFAVKSTCGIVDGKVIELFKDPITDSGVKKSLRGFIAVDRVDGMLVTRDQQPDIVDSELVPVFADGLIHKFHSLFDIRRRARGQ